MVLLLRICSQHSNPLSTFPLLLHPLSRPLTRETRTHIPMFALITTTVSHVEFLPQLQYCGLLYFAFVYSLLLPLVVLCFSFMYNSSTSNVELLNFTFLYCSMLHDLTLTHSPDFPPSRVSDQLQGCFPFYSKLTPFSMSHYDG